MDSMKSFKGYGKVDALEEQAFKRKARKRIIIMAVSAVVLVAAIIGAVVGVVVHSRNGSSPPPRNTTPTPQLTPATSLKAVCDATQYPDACFSSISAAEKSNTTDPIAIFKLSLQVAIDEAKKLPGFLGKYRDRVGNNNNNNDTMLNQTLNVCQGMFEDAADRLNDSLSAASVKKREDLLSLSKIDDLKTWLSASLTDQDTCLDALEDLNSTWAREFEDGMRNSTQFASNSLAIVAKILTVLANLDVPIHRRLLGLGGSEVGFPGWVRPGDRRLLEDKPAANLTVAKDGSGNCTTIQECVDKVAKKSSSRTVIYVKKGTYVENVLMDKSKWNVMMYGDGKADTIVSGNLNFVGGTPTFSTATFAVAGKGFMAKDMGFINTAGPEKHQAVALRSGSDLSVFYQCSFDGFQDTLYAHSNRQFYRDCDITGTIDFIFGNAAVVFQNCKIKPRQPMPNQFDTITAQGKKDINQNTGISIQKCALTAFDNLTAGTYLGRPWKNFSTTVVMQSKIDKFLNPLGWISWVQNVDPPNTIFYAEYSNDGDGARTDQRVTWTGYKPELTADEANKFTVGSFIQGGDWLPPTAVTFDSAL